MPLHVRIAYTTKTFSQVWKDYSAFSTDYATLMPLVAGGLATPLTADNQQALFYLLYARYANTPIICTDDIQWKMKMMLVKLKYKTY